MRIFVRVLAVLSIWALHDIAYFPMLLLWPVAVLVGSDAIPRRTAAEVPMTS